MNKHTQLSLEFLNTDVLIAILSACNSFSDLASVIRASPTLLHAFLSAKAAVLLHVASNILGPATRDAALLAQTSRFDALTHEDLACKVDAAAQDYGARLRVAGAPWVTTIDADTAVALTHVTRLTQFFVDLFCYFRFRYFAHDLYLTQANPPPPQPPLSRTEYSRVAQALLRRQLIVYFKGGKYSRPRDYPRFVRTVFSLFHPWELEQISDMDHFLGQLLVSLADYQMRKRGPNGERSPVRLQFWEIHYAPELGEFAKKIKSVLDSDCSLLDRLCQEQGIFSGRVSATYGLFNMFKGSHRYTTPSSSHSNQLSASDIAAADFGMEMSTSSEPWAWKDALRGHETCRWGCDLVKEPPPDSANQQDYEQAKSALESWRWFGMVFWDRGRAEQLKQSSELKSCKSGWLVPWQD